MSRDCLRRAWLDMQTIVGIKDKGRMGHGLEERRMCPNERGWIEKTTDILTTRRVRMGQLGRW